MLASVEGCGGVWRSSATDKQLRRTVPLRRGESDRDRGAAAGQARDVIQLVVDYAKQETLGPLKGLGRFLLFGVAGAIALSIGTTLLLLALLRVLETETGTTFRGNWSWAPYLLTAVAAIVVLGLSAQRIGKGPAKKRQSDSKEGA
jgi:hypothetical protein